MFNTNNYSTNVFINVSVNNLIEEEIKSWLFLNQY
jgi:hypothetical protein